MSEPVLYDTNGIAASTGQKVGMRKVRIDNTDRLGFLDQHISANDIF